MSEKVVTVDDLLEEASQYTLLYHISLGSLKSASMLASPIGSGTFVKFSVNDVVFYGILTAAHVAKLLCENIYEDANGCQLIGLSKPFLDRGLACNLNFQFIYFAADMRYFNSNSDISYRPDIAFIFLHNDVSELENEIFKTSCFYDLDRNQEFGFIEDTRIFSAFFRGACNDFEISADGCLKTSMCIGGGEWINFDEESHIHYWRLPNDTRNSIAGGSGAGFWRFRFDNGQLRKSFEGVIVAESKKCDWIEAIASSYLYDTFLPQLKKYLVASQGHSRQQKIGI